MLVRSLARRPGPTAALQPRHYSADAFLSKFLNHETLGVPRNAATDSEEGFPLGKQRCMLFAFARAIK